MLADFILVPETQLNAKPEAKYYNTTSQTCAQMCDYLDVIIYIDYLLFITTILNFIVFFLCALVVFL